MGKPPSHRCPDCHRPYHSAEGVVAHRAETQGECFAGTPLALQRRILTYRERFNLTVPPLPDDPNDFDVIDDD